MAGVGATRTVVPGWLGSLRKFFFKTSGYNQLGLLFDDIRKDSPDVVEAIRRMPKKLQDERQFRVTRALYLSMRKEILPEEEWTKYEDDVRYMSPYLREVRKELQEQMEWKKQ